MRRHLFLVLALSWSLLAAAAPAAPGHSTARFLPPERARSGAVILDAFSSIAAKTRESVVRFDINDKPVALGTIIDPSGLVISKASELEDSPFTGLLSNGNRVDAKILALDEDNDLALVRINAAGLKPISWAAQEATIGNWTATPGIERVPEAVGIISTQPRRILSKRAVIGVVPDFRSSAARIAEVMPGLGAEEAGLKPGDTIIAVNGAPIKDAEELVKTLRQYREGQTVNLRVQREDQELEVAATMKLPQPDPRWRGMERQERMNRFGGELSRRAEGFQLAIQHDTVLQPWQCGGPLVNLEGEAVGLNIARAGRIASYALPPPLVKQLVENLKSQTEVPVKQDTKEPADS